MTTANPRGGQWRPYRFEPVLYDDVDFRITYRHNGFVSAATLTLGDKTFAFTVTPAAAEVVVRATDVADVPDRAPAGVDVVTAGGDDTVALLRGYVVRSAA